MRSLDDLIAAASEGQLAKQELAMLLDPRLRSAFLAACARIERQYTGECAAQNDPCLESGCALAGEEGEVCLEPLLRAGHDYHKACGAEWIKFMRKGEGS
jgi:hypothetical protein